MTIVDANELDAILAQPMREKIVNYEGKDYRVVELNEMQSVEYELACQDKKNKFDVWRMRRALIAHCWVGPDGKRLVSDPDRLKTMRRSLAGFLYEACQEINRYEPGELEGLIKNSEEAGS